MELRSYLREKQVVFLDFPTTLPDELTKPSLKDKVLHPVTDWFKAVAQANASGQKLAPKLGLVEVKVQRKGEDDEDEGAEGAEGAESEGAAAGGSALDRSEGGREGGEGGGALASRGSETWNAAGIGKA